MNATQDAIHFSRILRLSNFVEDGMLRKRSTTENIARFRILVTTGTEKRAFLRADRIQAEEIVCTYCNKFVFKATVCCPMAFWRYRRF